MSLFNQKGKSLTQRKTQTGRSDLLRDKSRTAIPPGKRLSKNGKIYFEARISRSDILGKKI